MDDVCDDDTSQDITFESVGITVSVNDIYQRIDNEDVVSYLMSLKEDT